jgi:hypothetical protein
VLDVQDGRKIRQVMLNSLPQGPISCLNWIGEDVNVPASDLTMVLNCEEGWLMIRNWTSILTWHSIFHA